MSNALRKCNKCGKEKSLKHFYKSSHKTLGHQHRCKACMTEDYQEKNALREDEFFCTKWQRKVWKQFYGEQKPISTSNGLDKDDIIAFIPKSKTQRI